MDLFGKLMDSFNRKIKMTSIPLTWKYGFCLALAFSWMLV